MITKTTTAKVHRRQLQPGRELTVAGLRGTCTFRAWARNDRGDEWVDVVHRGRIRSVAPERITTVHNPKGA